MLSRSPANNACLQARASLMADGKKQEKDETAAKRHKCKSGFKKVSWPETFF